MIKQNSMKSNFVCKSYTGTNFRDSVHAKNLTLPERNLCSKGTLAGNSIEKNAQTSKIKVLIYLSGSQRLP